MQCFKPISIHVKGSPGEYGSDLKVPCGKCMGCRIARRREWMVRIMHELDSFKQKGVFITLTYNEENLPFNGSLDRIALQKFWKRLRKYYYPKKIKYYACGEYGGEGRPHYHAVVFGLDMFEMEVEKRYKVYNSHVLEKLWKFGFNSVGTVTTDSASYVAGYIEKKLFGEMAVTEYIEKGIIPPFSVMSKGIGQEFALSNAEQIREQLSITIKGKNVGLPKYYRKLLEIDGEQLAELGADKREKLHRRYQEVYDDGGLDLVDKTRKDIAKYRYEALRQKVTKRQGEPGSPSNLGPLGPK